MQYIRVGAATLNQTPLAWEQNLANCVTAIEQAREQGVYVLCLPELSITGYGCEDMFHAPGVLARALSNLTDLIPLTKGMFVAVGLPIAHRNGIYNAVALLVDGVIRGFVAKQHLAGDGIHYEPRWFKPWPEGVQATAAHFNVPIGDLIVNLDGIRIGFEICEDAWVADRPGARLARSGVDIILNPSASHFAFGKHAVRRRFVEEGSRAFGCTYVYANLLGNESGRAIFDGGALIATGGRTVAVGPRFSYQPVHVTSAVVALDSVRMSQTRTASFTPDVRDTDREIRIKYVQPPHCEPKLPGLAERTPAIWEESEHLKEEEFTRAVALALHDYCRKSRSAGFVVSLSGGADSAAVSVLVHTMTRLALTELGPEEFGRRIPAAAGSAMDAKAVTQRLLTCVYQATRYSGDVTREAARAVAEGVNARFLVLDVEPIVEGYLGTVGEALGKSFNWDTDDAALQNIQARVRGPSVWLIANLTGALLLATSNRSEAAVGYATMDGDTCGGLSPIGGIDKAFLRQWLSWMEASGPSMLGASPFLNAVNVQAPTAELRPPEAHQTDEDDLMPYPVLDAVERLAIRDKLMPSEILEVLRVQMPHHANALPRWIERFFRLWSRNQWKRERYAPSFHLDDENLDPKTWCRFPILSGGFDLELAEMQVREIRLPHAK